MGPSVSTNPHDTVPVAQGSAEANAHIVALMGALLPIWSRHMAAARSQSEAAVAQMLAAFTELGPQLRAVSAGAPASPHDQGADPIERMYVGFQYQDRISQMMSLLLDDMQRLSDLVAHSAEPQAMLSTDAWLARLESQYAMAEQRGTPAAEANGHDSDTVFF